MTPNIRADTDPDRGGPGEFRVRRVHFDSMRARTERLPALILPIVAITLVLFWAYVIDPLTNGYTIPCPWYEATGVKCPGCGLQRSAYALLHGDLRTAVTENLLSVLLLPLTLAAFVTWYLQRLPAFAHRRFELPTPLTLSLAVLIVAYWIVRNLPGTPFP